MQRRRRTHFLGGAAAACACLLAAAPAGAAERRGATQLATELGSGVTVTLQEETRRLGFVGTRPGSPIARPAGLSAAAPPRRAAKAFLGSVERELGLRDAGAELQVTASNGGPAGGSSVRFQQIHDGVPVIAGELVVNLDAQRNVVSMSGETEPRPALDTDPALSIAEADDYAIASVAREHGVDPASLDAEGAELSVFDSRLLGGPGLDIPQLVWRFEVTSRERLDIRQFVAVDAERGAVLASFNQVHAAKDREVCDAGTANSDVPCTTPVRVEPPGSPSGAVADSAGSSPGDVNAAYDFAGDTYDFFASEHGRDSLDGAGMKLISTADFCVPSTSPLVTCPGPYANAFWNGTQMAYGDGYAGADDVVGHELTHGVTEFTSSLYYYMQSGAINESLSDIWGEFIDQTNGAGTDTPGLPPGGVDWLLGEDIPGGAIRDMADPTSMGDPDKMTSTLWDADVDEGDNGGVHHNSGVGNKTAYLMTDGGTFNGKTVTGLGIPKAADIFYEAQTNHLTSGSDYLDLYNALNQGCSNLIGTGGITAANCAEVRDATDATEMDENSPLAPTRIALTCKTGGESAVNAFLDDLESGGGNFAPLLVSGSDYWAKPPGNVSYATSGVANLDAFDGPTASDTSIVMTLDVLVPPGGYVRFNHAHGFDDGGATTYAGGVVEYSTNSGASWSDLGSMFASSGGLDGFGGYNGSISTGVGVPAGMSGRTAFVRESNGYGSSRADVASLSGQSLRLRFRMGTDSDPGFVDQGWFIDDVQIYGCAPDTTITKSPKRPATAGAGTATADATPTLNFTSTSADPQGFECKVDSARYEACASGEPLERLGDGNHSVLVRALGSRLTPDPTPASASFKVTAAACKKAKKGVKKAKKKLKKAKKSGNKKKLKKAKKKLKKAKKKKRKNC